MDNPYATPKTEPSRIQRGSMRLPRGRRWAVASVCFLLSPLFYGMGTVVVLWTIARKVKEEPVDVHESITVPLQWAAWIQQGALIAGGVGAVLAGVAILAAKNRELWFFQWSTILGGVWCLLFFPYGIILGLSVIVLMLWHRRQFHEPFPRS